MTELFLFLLAAGVHELGHILCAALLNIPRTGFALCPYGAVMTFDFSGTTYGRELCVHLAGGGWGILWAVLALGLFGDTAVRFAGFSVSLALLNFLPVRGFDGGGILTCLLNAAEVSPERAERIGRGISIGFTVLLWTAVLWIELWVRADVSLLCFLLYVLIFHAEIVNSP